MARLTRQLFEQRTPKVARALLGTVLVRVVGGERLSGVIVETEAYRGAHDPASHAFRGRTARNAVMFGEGGHSYVYFSYGSHWCLNVTTEPAGKAGAVLIRAIEPKEGLRLMRANRQVDAVEHFADGPGKLTQALEIGASLNGEDLVTSHRLFLEKGSAVRNAGVGPRVGISRGVDFKWRFFARGSPFVSKGRPSSEDRTHN